VHMQVPGSYAVELFTLMVWWAANFQSLCLNLLQYSKILISHVTYMWILHKNFNATLAYDREMRV
jgi:hypothetical protein